MGSGFCVGIHDRAELLAEWSAKSLALARLVSKCDSQLQKASGDHR